MFLESKEGALAAVPPADVWQQLRLPGPDPPRGLIPPGRWAAGGFC